MESVQCCCHESVVQRGPRGHIASEILKLDCHCSTLELASCLGATGSTDLLGKCESTECSISISHWIAHELSESLLEGGLIPVHFREHLVTLQPRSQDEPRARQRLGGISVSAQHIFSPDIHLQTLRCLSQMASVLWLSMSYNECAPWPLNPSSCRAGGPPSATSPAPPPSDSTGMLALPSLTQRSHQGCTSFAAT